VAKLDADVAVVGAGPAGIAAACAACGAGARVAVVDEQPAPGGQIWRGHPSAAGRAAIAALHASPAVVLSGTAVWAAEGDGATLLTLDASGAPGAVRARAVVVATGAHDRPVAFPGWTLPGVFTAGGAQALAKGQGVAVGRRVVLAGAGPFLLPVARELRRAGATVVAVAEATRRRDWVRQATVAGRDPGRLREYGRYRRALAGVDLLWGHVVVGADGDEVVESVTLAPCDGAWRPDHGRARTLAVDAVCTAYGFVPVVELARTLGCALTPQGTVRCDADQRTTVPRVFVAGEPTGIGGADLAGAEGAIAGAAAAAHARAVAAPARPPALERRRRRHARFAALLEALFGPRPGLWELAAPETVLCRCEDVTAGEVRAAAVGAHGDLAALKQVTRVGQGPCQGRMCGELVARAAGAAGPYNQRPPLRPIPLGTLAEVSAPPS